jgi:hypothetical protein
VLDTTVQSNGLTSPITNITGSALSPLYFFSNQLNLPVPDMLDAIACLEGDLNAEVSADAFVQSLTDAGMSNSRNLRDMHKVIVLVARNDGVEEGKVLMAVGNGQPRRR